MLELLMYWHFNLTNTFYHEPVKETFIANVSCYNAEVGQTDNDPFTMANGKRVFDGAVANNYYKFGTEIEILGKRYIVSDRMNSRYGKQNFDIFMWDKKECIQFGRQNLRVKIIKL